MASSNNHQPPGQQQMHHRRQIQNPISIGDMRDGIVDEGTYSKYVNEIIPFLDWLHMHYPGWMTPYCLEQYDSIILLREHEKIRSRQQRVKESWMELIKSAGVQPLINLNQMTPEGVMDYIKVQANQKTGKYLSTSSYTGKRSAIHHLVRCHWGQNGWTEAFTTELDALWKGFTRRSTKEKCSNRRRQKAKRKQKKKTGALVDKDDDDTSGDDDDPSDDEAEDSGVEEDDEEDDRDLFQEGKSPMTPELYKSVCKWFLEWGTSEGIFCACFFVLTWNLACRSNNTARIRYSHMSWHYFDAMHVRFRHTKTQQHGEARRQKRACYSNPFEWYIDLPLLMGLYLATNFSTSQRRGLKLFPGGAKNQSWRVMNHFKKLLREHEDEVLAMGYDSIAELGLHSIRKGVCTYMASLPGGPSPAALCLRSGHSMGSIKDIYYHQSQGGDEFVGRCVSMLNMMNGEFGSSPAFFEETVLGVSDLMDQAVSEVFPHHHEIDGVKQILNRCLAAMVFHQQDILHLSPNHAARSISIYRQSALCNELATHVQIVNSWETNKVLTGIPPHVKLLVDVAGIRATQETIIEKLYTRLMSGVTDLLDDRQIGGGELTDARLNTMVANAVAPQFEAINLTLTQAFSHLSPASPASPARDLGETAYAETFSNTTFPIRSHGNGLFSRLPNDYEFPQAGAYDCWIKWNIGDTVRGIPPLRILHAKDFAFMDKEKPVNNRASGTIDGVSGHAGTIKRKRRATRKTYADLKFLCTFIADEAKSRGMDASVMTPENVRLMYLQVEPLLFKDERPRGTQHNWMTIMTKLRNETRRQKRRKENHTGDDAIT